MSVLMVSPLLAARLEQLVDLLDVGLVRQRRVADNFPCGVLRVGLLGDLADAALELLLYLGRDVREAVEPLFDGVINHLFHVLALVCAEVLDLVVLGGELLFHFFDHGRHIGIIGLDLFEAREDRVRGLGHRVHARGIVIVVSRSVLGRRLGGNHNGRHRM
jgi:hypothetical protein